MILIKCFTPSHIDNISACLRLEPEEMILVGSGEEMQAPADRYRRLLKQRRLDTRLRLCDVDPMDLCRISRELSTLIPRETECVIDLTGGDETVIMAVGALLSWPGHENRQNIRVQIGDRQLGIAPECPVDSGSVPPAPVQLRVEELILLHGGVLLPGPDQPAADRGTRAIDGLWSMVCQDPRQWNKSITQLNELESRSDSRSHIYLPLEQLRGRIPNFHEKENLVRQLLARFDAHGIIQDRSTACALEYKYTSDLMRYCTLKAGNVLEVKTLLEGRKASENGSPFFNDCRMSVSIDWDGILYPARQRIPETRNEIDVVLMHGTTPLFISCKNGNIGEEELYKLHTVATRFGGPNARKMLIATDLDRKSASANRAFTQRAWDMDIFLVSDADDLSREEWSRVLIRAMQ